MFDPTNRYGIITELARRTRARHMNLGKTALQKHVYFLQAVHKVDVGYDFRLYTYGPFSDQIVADLDTLEFFDGVDIIYDSAVNGYRIRPGENASNISNGAAPFLAKASNAIDSVLDDFGGMNAKELELRATIVFAEREFRSQGAPKLDDLAIRVQSIKPHFTLETIKDAVGELAQKGHIVLKGHAQKK